MEVKIGIIDLFCGAGGTSTGFENTPGCKVIACVNHDDMAIESHKSNHPDAVHFLEKIQKINMASLQLIVNKFKQQYPDALIILWASLECTNFSKAKGGLSRDADSRSLATFMPWYIKNLKPDYFGIENVTEFKDWGPLRVRINTTADGFAYCPLTKKKEGRTSYFTYTLEPVPHRKGSYYKRWIIEVNGLNNGYTYNSTELNSANYGAYTSRNRFFAWFAHDGLPIVWPMATHAKTVKAGYTQLLPKWKPVRDVLDLDDKGQSIFTRKKALSEKTLERIYAGLVKFVAGGKEAFLLKYNSVNGITGKYVPPDMDMPSPVIATQGRLAVCHAEFIAKYYSGKPEGKVNSSHEPASTLTTSDRLSLVTPEFLIQYNGRPYTSEFNCSKPAGTLCSKDRFGLIQPQFINRDFSSGGESQSINNPAGSVMPSPKLNLVSIEPFIMDTQFNNGSKDINDPLPVITADRHYHYLITPHWFNTGVSSIDDTMLTLIARMDKTPNYIVTTEAGYLAIEIFESDSLMIKKIKEFMAMYGIYDIKMRMLKIIELLKIQGFPLGYILKGTQTQQKKYIGNSVVPIVITCMAQALIDVLWPKLKAA